ncbi:hypothetical protein HDV06_006815 [Boothiomyces sp. JEL0866]|nr:hypothetical protein HDV06_006815 [Boothiomyces sp. JEL0866]
MSNNTTTPPDTTTVAPTTTVQITTTVPVTTSKGSSATTQQSSQQTTNFNSNIFTSASSTATATGSSSNSSNDVDFKSTGFIIAYIVAGALFLLFVAFVLYRSRSKSKESLIDLQAASGSAPAAPANKIPVLTDLPYVTETIPDRHPVPSSNVYVKENAPGWSGPKVQKSPQPQYAQYPIPQSAQLMPNRSPEMQNRSSPEPNYVRPLPNPPVGESHNSPYQHQTEGYDLNYYENAGYYEQNIADPNRQYYDQSQMQYYDQNQYQQYPPQGNYQQYYNYDQKQ